MTNDFTITEVEWNDAKDRLRAIREEVFIVEQNIPKELEWDGHDETAVHFLAAANDGTQLGTARLLPTGQIGRMAVRGEFRERHIGRALLEHAVQKARAQGRYQVFLHAQLSVADFYRKSGFIEHGAVFEEAGIPHVHMTRDLPIEFTHVELPGETGVRTSPLAVRSPAVPDHRIQPLRDEGEFRNAALELIAGARRQIHLFSSAIDSAIYDNHEMEETVSQFARAGRLSQMYVLIQEPLRLVQQAHRLLRLSQRLPSSIQIRVLNSTAGAELAARLWHVLLIDDHALLLQPKADAYEGFASFYDPVTVRRYIQEFQNDWSRAHIDTNLRELNL